MVSNALTETPRELPKSNTLPVRTERDLTERARTRPPNIPSPASVMTERQVHPVPSPPHSTSGTASSSTQSSSSDEEDDDHATTQQSRRRPMERSRLFRPARVTSPGEAQSRDLSPVFLAFVNNRDSNLGRSVDETDQAQRDHDTNSETQRTDLRDTLRSPQRARTLTQPDISSTTQISNQASHTGIGVATNKADATMNVQDAGSTEPQLSPTADAATPSMGSSFSDLDSMSRCEWNHGVLVF